MTGDGGHFRLQLMGSFGLFDPNGRRIALGRKQKGVVAVLALSADGVRARSFLQSMFWGLSGPQQAQDSLRSALRALRKSLGPAGGDLVGADRENVWINLRRIEVDVRGADGQVLDRQFLEGLDIRFGAEEFEDWLLGQRQQREREATPAGAPLAGPEPPAGRSRLLVAPPRRRPSVAVLRFAVATPEPADIHLADAVAEDLIGGLSKSRLLVVCSRHSSLSIDPQRGAQQICTQLDVDYIVQGSVRRAGDIVRVSAALVNGVQDATIWSARYDRHISDLLVIQDQITASIIATVEPALLGHEESRSLANRPRELGHWDLMMRGRWHFWRATFPDWEKARHYYERALEVAPHDASTLSQLALCMIGEIWGGAAADPEAQAKRAYQTALDAVSIDGSDAYAHYVLGTVSTILGRFDEGAAEQHRALEINPYLAAATGELGRLALFDGQLDEAVALSDQAIAASPNDPHLFLWFRHKALASFIAGDYDTAARQAAAACARSPHQFFLHYLLSACYAASGDQVRATRALHEGQRLLPGYSEAMIGRAMPFSQTANLDRYLEALWTAGWGRLPVSEQPTFLRPSHVQAS